MCIYMRNIYTYIYTYWNLVTCSIYIYIYICVQSVFCTHLVLHILYQWGSYIPQFRPAIGLCRVAFALQCQRFAMQCSKQDSIVF